MEKRKLSEVEKEILEKIRKKIQDDPEIPDSAMELLDLPTIDIQAKPKSIDDLKEKSKHRLKEIREEEKEGDNMDRKKPTADDSGTISGTVS